MASSILARLSRHTDLVLAREILKDSLGLSLILADASGPLAHQRNGVITASSEACRVSLFSRDGFNACDQHYRQQGASKLEMARPCHLGLATLSVPVLRGDEVVAQLIVSGFNANSLEGCPPVRPERLVARLREVDALHSDAYGTAASVPEVRNDRALIVRTVLRVAARALGQALEDSEDPKAAEDTPGMWGLVGRAPRMREVFEFAARVAGTDSTVLIQGESGTGKELVARALHDHSKRASGPFVAQNCAALPDALLESALFGHVRGAFSGATAASVGLFGAADSGTLFLDEVGDMSPALQVKLLRVLQDRSYLPVGGTRSRNADVRVIAATHRDLVAMVKEGTFRQDLFYRLHVVPMHLPPLRDRPGDLGLLVQHFTKSFPAVPKRVSQTALRCLERYEWPGNVRELRAEIERWQFSAADVSEVGPEHLSAAIRRAGGYVGDDAGHAAAAAAAGTAKLSDAVEALERAIVRRGLERTGGNRTQLARELGISRTTLAERIVRYGLSS